MKTIFHTQLPRIMAGVLAFLTPLSVAAQTKEGITGQVVTASALLAVLAAVNWKKHDGGTAA